MNLFFLVNRFSDTTPQAEKLFKQAKGYKEYDFVSLTQWRCIKGLESIAALPKP